MYIKKWGSYMVFDILIAGILLAFGFLAIYFSIEKQMDDKLLISALFIGILALLGGGWIILTKLTLGLILKKLAGMILTVLGFFITFSFPDAFEYQTHNTSITGIFIGIVVFVVGLYLLLF